jgi:adenosylcobinamide-GDP ribazoletransferase
MKPLFKVKKALDRFSSTFTLVSRIPLPWAFNFDPSAIDFWLPLVGFPVALLTAISFYVVHLLLGDPVLSILFSLIVQYGAFNLFHFDGLLDTADAFLGSVSREKRLAILKDSRIGVYALFTGTAYLALKFSLIYRLRFLPPPLLVFLFAYPITGRFAAALIPGFFTTAKKEGLGNLTQGSQILRTLGGFFLSFLLWIGLAILCFSFFYPLNFPSPSMVPTIRFIYPWLFPLWTAPMITFLLGRLYQKNLGGYTGDTLGAAVELGELGHLFMLYLWTLIPG